METKSEGNQGPRFGKIHGLYATVTGRSSFLRRALACILVLKLEDGDLADHERIFHLATNK